MQTSHLIYTANQMAGFYMECNTGLKWIKNIRMTSDFVDPLLPGVPFLYPLKTLEDRMVNFDSIQSLIPRFYCHH